MGKIIKRIFVIILFGLLTYGFNSCEEVDELLTENGENNNDTSIGTCHTEWVGSWKGTSTSKDLEKGTECDTGIELYITFNSNEAKLIVSPKSQNSFPCVNISSAGLKGDCSNNSFSGVFKTSVELIISLTKSGSSINGNYEEYKVDSNGNSSLYRTHYFTVSKQ